MESQNKARPFLVAQPAMLPASSNLSGSVSPIEPILSPNLRALLKRCDLQNILRISGRTIDRLVARGSLPKPIRVGQRYRWRVVDIERFIAEQDQSEL